MSLTNAVLVREEANLASSISEAKLKSAISNAEDEIRRIIRNLESLVVDFAYLKDADNTFSLDDGDSYRFTYEQIGYMAEGYDNATNTNYVALLASINASLSYNSQDLLNDQQKYDLRQAGRDFRKAETLLALSHFVRSASIRPTNDGGFVTEIAFGSGKAQLMGQGQVKEMAVNYRRQAFRQLFGWLKDPHSIRISDSIDFEDGQEYYYLPDSFTHPDINIQAVPTRISRKDRDPRKRYSG